MQDSNNKTNIASFKYAEEVPYDDNQKFSEGSKQKITINKYERDPKARAECINIHGYSCKVCGFDFGKVYGELGKEYIHVHHLTPMKNIGEKYTVTPETDLIPVCPNCHAMLHKLDDPSDLEQLKKMKTEGLIGKMTKEQKTNSMTSTDKFQSYPSALALFQNMTGGDHHIFNIKKFPDNYYPDVFQDYPGAKLKNLGNADKITIKVFFKVGVADAFTKAYGGYVDLSVKEINNGTVKAMVLTSLPEEFNLAFGMDIEVSEEEILYHVDAIR